ncbi:hypothetical protein EON67_12185 [archaeon]|nr:MAG: hypothetical protein EON67_12185 [archaeon]
MATTAGGVPAAAPTSSLADVELVLNDGAVVADEEAAMRFAAENGADALLSTIEAMQAKLEALKAAAARGTALASASAATAVSGA